jgi:hypothetical protein
MYDLAYTPAEASDDGREIPFEATEVPTEAPKKRKPPTQAAVALPIYFRTIIDNPASYTGTKSFERLDAEVRAYAISVRKAMALLPETPPRGTQIDSHTLKSWQAAVISVQFAHRKLVPIAQFLSEVSALRVRMCLQSASLSKEDVLGSYLWETEEWHRYDRLRVWTYRQTEHGKESQARYESGVVDRDSGLKVRDKKKAKAMRVAREKERDADPVQAEAYRQAEAARVRDYRERKRLQALQPADPVSTYVLAEMDKDAANDAAKVH